MKGESAPGAFFAQQGFMLPADEGYSSFPVSMV